MPSEGRAPWLPFAGVICRSLASSAACAWADAEACALLCAGEAVEWLAALLVAGADRAMPAATARPAHRRACRADLRSVPRTVTLLCPSCAPGRILLAQCQRKSRSPIQTPDAAVGLPARPPRTAPAPW